MPTIRRRGKQRRSGLDSERTRYRLRTGLDSSFWDGEPLEDDELAEAWAMFGDEILAEYIAMTPGSRPFGWWLYQAPEPRQQIGDGPEPQGAADFFGCPSVFLGQPPSDMYESERDYLERLGLLTDDERKALQLG
jgi:hypothetical protein